MGRTSDTPRDASKPQRVCSDEHMREARLWFRSAIVTSLLVLASGCGEDTTGENAEPSGTATTSETTLSGSPETTEPPPTPSTPAYKVGGTARAAQVAMTVTKVEAVDLGSRGEPGMRETLEVRVKTCTPETAASAWELNPFQFAAVTRASQVIPVGVLLSGVREPAYPTFGNLPPGRCQEGWVQIAMDKGQARTVKAIEWQPNSGETFAAWKVRQPLKMGVPDY